MFQPPISCFTDGSTVNVFCSCTVQALQKYLRVDPEGEKKIRARCKGNTLQKHVGGGNSKTETRRAERKGTVLTGGELKLRHFL